LEYLRIWWMDIIGGWIGWNTMRLVSTSLT
jgi:hypothetical protein